MFVSLRRTYHFHNRLRVGGLEILIDQASAMQMKCQVQGLRGVDLISGDPHQFEAAEVLQELSLLLDSLGCSSHR